MNGWSGLRGRRPVAPGHLLRVSVILFVSVSMLTSALGLTAAPAVAEIDKWRRVSRDFQGVSLRTRGYIDDNCVETLFVPCFTQSSARSLRKEATAQATTMKTLAFMLGDLDSTRKTMYERVDWEVGPQDSWQKDIPQEPPDADLAQDECEPLAPWRVDIVVDQARMLEVKAWKSGKGRGEVQRQLICYDTKADQLGVSFSPETALAGWATGYIAAVSDRAG